MLFAEGLVFELGGGAALLAHICGRSGTQVVVCEKSIQKHLISLGFIHDTEIMCYMGVFKSRNLGAKMAAGPKGCITATKGLIGICAFGLHKGAKLFPNLRIGQYLAVIGLGI